MSEVKSDGFPQLVACACGNTCLTHGWRCSMPDGRLTGDYWVGCDLCGLTTRKCATLEEAVGVWERVVSGGLHE